MNRYRSFLVWYLFGALAACGQEDPSPSPSVHVTVRDSVGIWFVTIQGQRDDLPEWTLHPEPHTSVSGDAEPFLGRIGEVELLSDGGLLVEDNQTDGLYRFETDGSFGEVIATSGEGPGELQNLTELTVIQGDTAFAFDRRLRRISAFAPDGELIGTIPVAPEDGGTGTLPLDAWAVDSEHFVLHRPSAYDTAHGETLPRRDERTSRLFVIDGNRMSGREIVQFAGEYSVDFEGGDGPAPFSNRPAIQTGFGVVAYTSGLKYEITVADRRLSPIRIIRWSQEPEPLAESVMAAVRASIEADFAPFREQRPDLVNGIMEATFAPHMLPEFLPALGPMFIDQSSGDIWVSEFRPTTETWSQEHAWHVLNSEGHPVAKVTLKPNSKLAGVRASRVALVERDEVDVEHVRVYSIRVPDLP